MSLATAAYARLVADATTVAAVDTYRGDPAVLVADPGTLPEDLPSRFVVIIGVEADEPDDCKAEQGRDQVLVIRCYSDAKGSTQAIDALAERVRFLFHRQPAGLTAGAFLVECSGPSLAPTDASMYGRQIDVRVQSLVS